MRINGFVPYEKKSEVDLIIKEIKFELLGTKDIDIRVLNGRVTYSATAPTFF